MHIDISPSGRLASSAFACLRVDAEIRINAEARRNWERHPELHAEFRTFERYALHLRRLTSG